MQVTMISLLVAMVIMNSLLYLGTSIVNRQMIYRTLDYIIDHQGALENWDEDDSANDSSAYEKFLEDLFALNGDYRSPEFRFSTRYFAIYFDADDQVTDVKTSHISAITDEEAIKYGKIALKDRDHVGRIADYYYQVDVRDDNTSMIIFLDGRSAINANNRVFRIALMVTALGIILAFIIARLLAERAVQSEIKNASIQKRFMTDISHELKTPLAVIRANTEMEEIMSGENEWTASTLRQVERMNGLIQSLVMISRAEEKSGVAATDTVDVTAAARETVQNFKALAINSGKSLNEDIEDNVQMLADEAQIRELCSLLVDNAIKYCDDKGEIMVALKKKGHVITLDVSNSYVEGAEVDYTRFFDRFYRQDDSHNIDKGGYGIGLSIAESIVQRYKGSIDASWKQGVITFKCQLRTTV